MNTIFLYIIFFLAGSIVGMCIINWKWKKEMRNAVAEMKEPMPDRLVGLQDPPMPDRLVDNEIEQEQLREAELDSKEDKELKI